MNHSCEPNTFSADEQLHEGGGSYKTVALRDIEKGEEITCDYDLFELDSRKKGIDKCECGSKRCRGYAHGFSFCPEDTRRALLPYLYPEVLEAWLAMEENKDVMYRQVTLPEGVSLRSTNSTSDTSDSSSDTSSSSEDSIDKDKQSYQLVAEKQFFSGDLIFSYQSEYFDSSKVKTLLVDVSLRSTDNTTATDTATGNVTAISVVDMPVQEVPMWDQSTRIVKQLDILEHTVNRRDGNREFFQFDTFCDHSCEPNALFSYTDGSLTDCKTVALKDIAPGEAITNDYFTFDGEFLDGTEFTCLCGSAQCRGVIKA
jgi:hypothetical protein